MTNSTWQYLDTQEEDAVSRKDIRCYRLMGGYLIPKLLGYICSKQTRLYLLLVLWRILLLFNRIEAVWRLYIFHFQNIPYRKSR